MSRVTKPVSGRFFQSFLVVEGSGGFPVDMLRYDSAFPYEERDAFLIQSHDERRRVLLVRRCVNSSDATVARWRSFRWTVVGTFSDTYAAKACRDEVLP